MSYRGRKHRLFGLQVEAAPCSCRKSSTYHQEIFNFASGLPNIETDTLCLCGGIASVPNKVEHDELHDYSTNSVIRAIAYIRSLKIKLFHLKFQQDDASGSCEKSIVNDGFSFNLLAVLVPPSIFPISRLLESKKAEQLEDDNRTEEKQEKPENSYYSSISRLFRKAKPNSKEKKSLEVTSHDLEEQQWNEAILNSLGSFVHPAVAQLRIRAIFNLEHDPESGFCNGPADVLLFDVPPSVDHEVWMEDLSEFTINDIVESINGDGMSNSPNYVIKAFPVHALQVKSMKGETFIASLQTTSPFDAEIPSCPVCLHRIGPSAVGLPEAKPYQLCSHLCGSNDPFSRSHMSSLGTCKNKLFLIPWPPPSSCQACRVTHDYEISGSHELDFAGDMAVGRSSICSHASSSSNSMLIDTHDTLASSPNNNTGIKCADCGMTQTLWVCLTCGMVACGRYSHGHAVKHHYATNHPYSLELATQRIWAYKDAEFVQRADFLKCPVMNSHGSKHVDVLAAQSIVATAWDETESKNPNQISNTYADPNLISSACHDSYLSGNTPANVSSTELFAPKKTMILGEVYEALLQSALEDQAQHYEGEISRLCAELAEDEARGKELSPAEREEIAAIQADIAELRSKTSQLAREHLEVQGQEAGYRASYERLLRQQQIQKEILEKIRADLEHEREAGENQIEELEQQIRDLSAYLKIQQKVSQDSEIKNSRFFATSKSPTKKSAKKGAKRNSRK